MFNVCKLAEGVRFQLHYLSMTESPLRAHNGQLSVVITLTSTPTPLVQHPMFDVFAFQTVLTNHPFSSKPNYPPIIY